MSPMNTAKRALAWFWVSPMNAGAVIKNEGRTQGMVSTAMMAPITKAAGTVVAFSRTLLVFSLRGFRGDKDTFFNGERILYVPTTRPNTTTKYLTGG